MKNHCDRDIFEHLRHSDSSSLFKFLVMMYNAPGSPHIMFFLFQLLLANKELQKFEQVLNTTELIKQEVLPHLSIQKSETVKVFSGFLKVYYYVITGRVSL